MLQVSFCYLEKASSSSFILILLHNIIIMIIKTIIIIKYYIQYKYLIDTLLDLSIHSPFGQSFGRFVSNRLCFGLGGSPAGKQAGKGVQGILFLFWFCTWFFRERAVEKGLKLSFVSIPIGNCAKESWFVLKRLFSCYITKYIYYNYLQNRITYLEIFDIRFIKFFTLEVISFNFSKLLRIYKFWDFHYIS